MGVGAPALARVRLPEESPGAREQAASRKGGLLTRKGSRRIGPQKTYRPFGGKGEKGR